MKPLDDSEPTEVGPYRLLAELGHGGMGRVLLAAHDGRLAAVKQVHARFASDDDFRTRFRREVAASRRVSGAYTAAVMDADADAALPWLASVFVTGPSLGAAVRETGPLPEAAVRRLALGLASALTEIHRVGLIHRDLKPENVLLPEDGVRVIDFGIARAVEHPGAAEPTQLTQTGWVIGSPPFMSPEQAESRELTPASDVFSLGAVLVLALTGASPFSGTSTFQTLANVVQGVPDLNGVPKGLRGIVEACLAKDPAARPTPARLIGLLGPVPPAARVWPPAVHALVADQQARLGALLGEGPTPTPTVVVRSRPAEAPAAPDRPAAHPTAQPTTHPTAQPTVTAPARVPAPAVPSSPAPVPSPFSVPVSVPVPVPQEPPRRRGRGRTVALVAAGLLVVAGTGVGGYLLLREDPDTDKYRTLPACKDVNLALPSYERNPERDFSVARATGPEIRCSWTTGTSGEAKAESAEVWWNVRTPTGRFGEATDRQKTEHAAQSAGGGTADLDVGDEAYWAVPSEGEGDCVLHLRDSNLTLRVSVTLRTKGDPETNCRPEAVSLARNALDVPVLSPDS